MCIIVRYAHIIALAMLVHYSDLRRETLLESHYSAAVAAHFELRIYLLYKKCDRRSPDVVVRQL